MFQHANYFLNFSKLLGLTPESKVDNRTSQQHILQMYDGGKEIPWDVRAAQPGLIMAEEQGMIKGVVLDAGCGYGDNAIYLAKKGFKVVGFDFSAKAIEIAKDRAQQNGVDHLCEFVQADALDVPNSALHGRKFDTLLDSACLQCFDPATQGKYIANMEPLIKRGGHLVLLVVCNQSQLRSWCRGVRWMQNYLSERLLTKDKGWNIQRIEHTTFLENIPMVKITKGVRTFEPVTPSPCLLLVASPPQKITLSTACFAIGIGVAIAAGAMIAMQRVKRN